MPNTSDIAGQQRTMLLVLRVFALLPILPCFALVGTSVIVMVVQAIDRASWPDDDNVVPLGIGLSLGGFSVLLWAASPWLVRRGLPNPIRVLCPSCGYDLADTITDRCNECGLALSEEFREGTVLAGPAEKPPARIAALQGTMTAAARFVAAINFVPLCGTAFGMLMLFVNNFNSSRGFATETMVALWMFLVASGTLVACLIPWVLPRLTGRLLAPVRAGRTTSGEPDPRASLLAGIARLIAAMALGPLLAFTGGFTGLFVEELTRSNPFEEAVAASAGMATTGLLGVLLATVPWLAPRTAASLLRGPTESEPPQSDQ